MIHVLLPWAAVVLMAWVVFGWLIPTWIAPDATCYEMRRLHEADAFVVCGDAVETYLESGCCHVMGREER